MLVIILFIHHNLFARSIDNMLRWGISNINDVLTGQNENVCGR